MRLSDKTWRLTERDRGGRERRDSDNSEVLSPDNSVNGDTLTRIENPT